jgi:hypothetical protein
MEGFKYNIPYTYKKINDDRSSSINIDKFINNDDFELVLIETPKNVYCCINLSSIKASLMI